MHICVNKITSIGSDDDLSPGRRQAIVLTNAGVLLIWPLGSNISEIFIGIHVSPFKKMHLKMSSAKCRTFSLGLNVLMCPVGHSWNSEAMSVSWWCTMCHAFFDSFVHWLRKPPHYIDYIFLNETPWLSDNLISDIALQDFIDDKSAMVQIKVCNKVDNRIIFLIRCLYVALSTTISHRHGRYYLQFILVYGLALWKAQTERPSR